MDSFFLAEMFKYLYLLFSEKSQVPIDVDDYIFTTEAHLLPVSLSTTQPPCHGNNTVNGDFITNMLVELIFHKHKFTHLNSESLSDTRWCFQQIWQVLAPQKVVYYK